MGKDPKIIRTDMGNGLTTLVPYGISADVSVEARQLSNYYSKLARSYKARHHRRAK
jgi:hypothetical protein